MAVPYFLETTGILAQGNYVEVLFTEENSSQNRWTCIAGGSGTGLVSKSSTVNLYDIAALINGNSTTQQVKAWLFELEMDVVFNNGMIIEDFADVTLVNNGVIAGRGGNGGYLTHGSMASVKSWVNGGAGNHAVTLQGNLGRVTINNKLDGYLIGGGGGGRGGWLDAYMLPFPSYNFFFETVCGGGGGWNGGNGGQAKILIVSSYGYNGNKYFTSYGSGGYGPVSGGSGVTFTSRYNRYYGGVPNNSCARSSRASIYPQVVGAPRWTTAQPQSEGGGNGGGTTGGFITGNTLNSVGRNVACQSCAGAGGGATPTLSMGSNSQSTYHNGLTGIGGANWRVKFEEPLGGINQNAGGAAGSSSYWNTGSPLNGVTSGGGGGRGAAGSGGGRAGAAGNSVKISGSSPNLVYIDKTGDTGKYYGTRDF